MYIILCNALQEKVANNNTTIGSSLPANSMVGMNNMASVNGLNSRQMMVFNLIRASTVEQGISKQDMHATLKEHMALAEFEYVYFYTHWTNTILQVVIMT